MGKRSFLSVILLFIVFIFSPFVEGMDKKRRVEGKQGPKDSPFSHVSSDVCIHLIFPFLPQNEEHFLSAAKEKLWYKRQTESKSGRGDINHNFGNYFFSALTAAKRPLKLKFYYQDETQGEWEEDRCYIATDNFDPIIAFVAWQKLPVDVDCSGCLVSVCRLGELLKLKELLRGLNLDKCIFDLGDSQPILGSQDPKIREAVEKEFGAIKSCSKLEKLSMEGLLEVSILPLLAAINLRHLILKGCRWGEEFKYLQSNSSMKVLDLSYSDLVDQNNGVLLGQILSTNVLRGLEELYLDGCGTMLTAKGFTKLFKNMRYLHVLSLNDSSVNHKLLNTLAKSRAAEKLKKLSVKNTNPFSNEQHPVSLGAFVVLSELDIGGCDVARGGIKSLPKSLKVLKAGKCRDFMTVIFPLMTDLKSLKELHVNDTNLTAGALRSIVTMVAASLVALDITNCSKINSTSSLARCPRLRSLKARNIGSSGNECARAVRKSIRKLEVSNFSGGSMSFPQLESLWFNVDSSEGVKLVKQIGKELEKLFPELICFIVDCKLSHNDYFSMVAEIRPLFLGKGVDAQFRYSDPCVRSW